MFSRIALFIISCVALLLLQCIHKTTALPGITSFTVSKRSKDRLFSHSCSRQALQAQYQDIGKLQQVIMISGGSIGDGDKSESWSMRKSAYRNALGLWGVLQVVSILANALKRLIPIAIQPLMQQDISFVHWLLYGTWCLYMMYAEGYKAFQLKFSPMVVSCAFSLSEKPNIINVLLAGPYSMGLFGASKKRMIVSWSITAGVFSLVKVVKMLPYPYRSIIDAGVVAGLSYGTASILLLTVRQLLGGDVQAPDDGKENGDKSKKTS